MDNPFTITQKILAHRLANSNTSEDDAALVAVFLDASPSYLVTRPDGEGKAVPYIHDSMFALFLNQDTAKAIAEKLSCKQKISLGVAGGSSNDVRQLLSEVASKARCIKLYGIPPITTTIKTSLSQESGNEVMPEPQEAPEAKIAPDVPPKAPAAEEPPEGASTHKGKWKLVPEVKQVLSMPATADRRKIDPAAHFENLHSLLNKLVQTNGINPSDLDKQLGMSPGFTKSLCDDLKRDNTPKKIVILYLDYFGLTAYLYLFKGQCSEVAKELADNPHVDSYRVKQARNTTEERFKLLSVKTGTDSNGAYLYRLTLQSPHRKQDVIVSSPFNFVVGREYEIEGLSPLGDSAVANKSAIKGAETTAAALVSTEEQEAEVLAKIEEEMKNKGKPQQQRQPQPQKKVNSRMSGKNRYMEETPEEKFEREKNIVLEYIIRTEGCSPRDAQKKFEPLSDFPDIVSDFAKYIKTRKPGSCSSRGYNAARLMNKLHYGPYDAYVMLAGLERDPKKTQEILKYRETDPQYQKPEKPPVKKEE